MNEVNKVLKLRPELKLNLKRNTKNDSSCFEEQLENNFRKKNYLN